MNTTRRRFRESSVSIPAKVKEPDATEAQLGYIDSLLGQVQLKPGQRAAVDVDLDKGLTMPQASRWIDRLLELKDEQGVVTRAPASMPDVPAGRYAVTGDDGTTDFYKVDRPEQGRWAGYTFVNLLVAQGGHGIESLREIKTSKDQARTILERIVADGIEDASARFGRAIGHCGVCGRELTNDDSIERGIGPVCAGRMGWS